MHILRHDPHHFINQVTKPDFTFSYDAKCTPVLHIMDDLELKEEERERVCLYQGLGFS